MTCRLTAARRKVVGLPALLALAVAGCGGDTETSSAGDGSSGEARPAGGGPGPVHVHGLGVDPKDRALFIATHTGLFRVGPDERRADRVGESDQDTMGFTVVGPGRFLGSGHPGALQSGPALLGLIRSDSGGDDWQPVSLAGKADFHILRSAHGRVYGFDSANSRLMISRDGGESWDERQPPAPLIDLAVDPEDPQRLLASGEDGLFESRDEGRRWRPIGDELGLLAWPTRDRLYLVDGDGAVQVSGDGGRRWRQRGGIGGQPAALLAEGREGLYVALPDGTIKRSRDGGRSWAVRSRP